MQIENPQYVLDQGYPILEVEIDGRTYLIDSEQKPTLVRHGIVAVPCSAFTARLGLLTIPGATDDPRLFRLALAFGLEVRSGRFKPGPATDALEAEEVRALGDLLAPFGREDCPTWEQVIRKL